MTLLVYAALSGLLFLLMPQLQSNLRYSAVRAGAALLPVSVIMGALSPRAGRLAARIGPRLPMTIGALLAAVAMLLFSRIGPGASYVTVVLPAAIVFGLGIGCLVAPLTTAVLGAVDQREAGVASGINNAAARLAGLLATAALPLAAGIGGVAHLEGAVFSAGYTPRDVDLRRIVRRRSRGRVPHGWPWKRRRGLAAALNRSERPTPNTLPQSGHRPFAHGAKAAPIIIRGHAARDSRRPPFDGARPAPPQLPPLLRRAERLAGRHVDHPHRDQLARLPPHRLGAAARRRRLLRADPDARSWRPVAGVFVDRWNRHRVLVVTQVLSMLQSLALAVLALAGIITVARGAGAPGRSRASSTPSTRPARQAFVVDDDRGPRRPAQRHRAQLVDGEREPDSRPVDRRRPHRGGGRGLVLPGRRDLLPGGDRVAARDARRARGPRAAARSNLVEELSAGFRYVTRLRSDPHGRCCSSRS